MIQNRSVQPASAMRLSAKTAKPQLPVSGFVGTGGKPEEPTALPATAKGAGEDRKLSPYLTVVAASRNDDHGGDPLRRTQIFIESLAAQAEEFRLSIELILVDWNPVEGRPGLGKALRPPKAGAEWFTARVITVPSELHQRFKYGDRLAFFQMIAKNVGIRRARGKFILATNIDILFSPELMAFLGRRRLDPKRTYRANRLDIPGKIPRGQQPAAILEQAGKNILRHHWRNGPAVLLAKLKKLVDPETPASGSAEPPASPVPAFTIRKEGDALLAFCQKKSVPLDHLHTNGCGDFTLLSREGWHAIRGYPEFEAFSFNIDSMGLVAAHHAGFREASLLPPCVCYHIEHAVGSGWSPEGERKLFSRLDSARILNPEWPVLTQLAERMNDAGKQLEFNYEHWGLGQHELPEAPLGLECRTKNPDKFSAYPVGALRSEFDLDRLTLWHERSLAKSEIRSEPLAKSEIRSELLATAQLYWPDSNGHFSEAASVSSTIRIGLEQHILFSIPAFCTAYSLRLDPSDRAGLIEIFSVAYYDGGKRNQLFDAGPHGERQIRISGTCRFLERDPSPFFRRRQSGVLIESYGTDPMVFLPPLSGKLFFPILLEVRLRFLAID